MSPRRPAVLAALAVLAGAACQQEMRDQPKVEPLEAAAFFADGQGARQPPPGSVPRGAAQRDEQLWRGTIDGQFARGFPFAIGPADLARGEERYGIYCAPCHGGLGLGDGMAVRRGYPAPPPLTLARLRAASEGELFDTIGRGRANMPDYEMIPVHDRWRIVAFVRVLQLSQHVDAATLAPADREALDAAAAPPGGRP